MPRFVSKPVEIEAVQWFPGVKHPGVYEYTLERKVSDGPDGELIFGEVTKSAYTVTTMHEQHVHLAPGDWIIAEPVPNRYYPCKPEVFAAKYVPVAS